MFPAELVVPPRRTKPRLTEEELRSLGDCEPVNGRVYAHGTLGGYVTAKCRCAGCRQWARDYELGRRAAASGPARRRWEKSRDPDELYLDKCTELFGYAPVHRFRHDTLFVPPIPTLGGGTQSGHEARIPSCKSLLVLSQQ